MAKQAVNAQVSMPALRDHIPLTGKTVVVSFGSMTELREALWGYVSTTMHRARPSRVIFAPVKCSVKDAEVRGLFKEFEMACDLLNLTSTEVWVWDSKLSEDDVRKQVKCVMPHQPAEDIFYESAL
jgi:hypothetical protein